MKLKAPQGIGNPCVAGVVLAASDGLYEVEAEIGALLIACFGFVEADARENVKARAVPGGSGAPRRRAPAKKSPI